MSLAIVGGTVVDLIFPRVRRLPVWPRHLEFTRSNLEFMGTPPIVSLGGNGANAAYVAARCGAKVTLHTQIGADDLGQMAWRWLDEAGCRIRPATRAGSTAVNVTAAGSRHQRATFFYPGGPIAMPAKAALPRSVRYLLVCGWPHPPLAGLSRLMHAARRRGAFTALDAGPILGRPWTLRALRPVFAELDLLLANEHEARMIAGSARLDTALDRMRAAFQGHVIIKRGNQGALWLPTGERSPRRTPGRRVRVVNTVGAGDGFNGALLAALDRGGGFAKALRLACRTAAGVVGSSRGILGAKPGPVRGDKS